jgi:IS1 family transposase
MNKLSIDQKVRVVSCLVEGNSLRSTVRMTGIHRTTIQNLLVELGKACSAFQDKTFRNLKLTRLQCDEIWAFCGCKEKNATPAQKAAGWGSVWTWSALDAKTKLIPCWYVGERDATAAYHFMHDLRGRLAGRIQLTTDGLKLYVEATEDAFGSEIDYAQLIKIYGVAVGPGSDNAEIRYSPAQCMGARKAVISGQPEYAHISTSFSERQNLTMRMSMRRFTRLTNGFSKKVENHEAAVALHFMYLQFCAGSHEFAHDPGNGSWRFKSRMDISRNCGLNQLNKRTSNERTHQNHKSRV